MQRIVILNLILLLSIGNGLYGQSKNPIVVMDTNYGNIKIELNAAKAPITVANFLKYVEAKHYDGTIFHRVIENFMIQGGGHTADMKEKATRQPIKNEAGNGLSNLRGTIAVARAVDPNSGTAQFFINVKDNRFLDRSDKNAGYAVFGKVIDGMDVVDKIRKVKTRRMVGVHNDVPVDPVVIKSMRLWQNVALRLKGSFAPNKVFTVTAFVSNPSAGQSLELVLPDGIKLVEGPRLQPVPKALDNDTSLVIWKATAMRPGKFELRVRSSTGIVQNCFITIPPPTSRLKS